ncbi:serine hydrolase domain-containing protein [Aeromicrobium sp. UC242_57]|uniref:serine hydrolase domain-containing protein n=1 Tax=Aeromicrobium sp. UC242_57 TaxID=3374624 RepID=UPI0037C153EB
MDASTTAALRQRLAAEQSRQRLPSVVAGLVRDGELIWSGGAGTLDARADGPAPSADTQYRIGSISKTFVAVEVLRLRDAGQLDLADTIGTHLPELPFGHVTIAQLLSHTSGLQAETSGGWWERTAGGPWDELLAGGLNLRFTPGTTYHYTNVGYGVLGELITRLRGVPWHQAVQTGILDPLGMSRTTLRPVAPAAPGLAVHPLSDLVHVEPEHDAASMAPAGQLWSTVHDLATWAAFVAGRTEGGARARDPGRDAASHRGQRRPRRTLGRRARSRLADVERRRTPLRRSRWIDARLPGRPAGRPRDR